MARLRERSGKRSEHLLAEVLDGVLVDHEVFKERATAAGCDPAVSRALFIASAEASASLRAEAGLPGLHVALRAAPAEHAVVVVAVPLPEAIETVTAKLAHAATRTRTTVLFLGLHGHPVDAHLSYVGSLPVLPYLSRIADGRSLLDAGDVLLYRLAAALPEPVRRSLHHEVFGRTARRSLSATLNYDALETFIRNDFRVTAIARETGRDRKTVYGTRDELNSATGRSLHDTHDQTILSLAYAVHRLVR